MAHAKEYRPINIDVEPFLSIMAIVLKLISLILVVIVMRIAINPTALKVVTLPGLYPGKGSYEHPKNPTYIDCYPDKVMVFPGNKAVTWENLQRPGNAIEQALDQVQANAAKEYVILLARPQSTKFYRTVRKLVDQRPIEVGVDMIEADYFVDWDAALKATGVHAP